MHRLRLHRKQRVLRSASTSQRPGCGNCFRSGMGCGRECRIVISKISVSGTPPPGSQNKHSEQTHISHPCRADRMLAPNAHWCLDYVPVLASHTPQNQATPSPSRICTSPSPGEQTPSAGGSAFPFADQFSLMRSAPAPHLGSCVPRNSGNKVVQFTVPDTITEWKAMTFCTSQSRSFGLSPTVGMTTFQPFFVDLMLPYSVIHGESFCLTAASSTI